VAAIKFTDTQKPAKIVLEIRIGGGGKAAQTVFPGSVHPTGETIEWGDHLDVAAIGGEELKRMCARLAACALLARSYPQQGGRHEGALVVAGFLCRCGFALPDIKLFVDTLTAVTRQPLEKQKDMVRAAADTAEAFAAGRNTFGLPKMKECFGEAVAKKCIKWLGSRAEAPGANSERAEEWRNGPDAVAGGVTIEDFNAYMPTHSYIYTPSREMWLSSSVDARIFPVPLLDKVGNPIPGKGGAQKTIPASLWLDRHKPVEQMSWAPGEPMLIPNRLISDGGWIERDGVTCFNLYRPPTINLGNAAAAGPWLTHVGKVFPSDDEHIIKWLAHRVQCPQEKINHALVFGGNQGIGKDTMLEPVKRAVGPWNFKEVSPQQMLGRFNGFLKSVILRVSEARDLGGMDRFQFYDHMKAYTAAPPDVLRVDEKFLREHYVLNCCGVIITTNHKADGIYLPPDDRRHYVAWSDLTKDDFTPYLAELDLSGFDPKAPPPKTQAFWDIADANRAPEDAELADVLDKMGRPGATTLSRIIITASGTEIEEWLRDRKNRRAIPHRLEMCGYVPVRNDDAESGLWYINGTRQAIYGKKTLSIRERLKAARDIVSPALLSSQSTESSEIPF
jgi:Family of unknown function (DUF5906)